MSTSSLPSLPFFFFNDPATTEIYTLSLHDALPIFSFIDTKQAQRLGENTLLAAEKFGTIASLLGARYPGEIIEDRKSTRLNSSHTVISYAVFCLKKKRNDTLDVAKQ